MPPPSTQGNDSLSVELYNDNLRFFLQRKNLNQADLARASGVSNAYLSDIQNGKGNPTIEKMDSIAKALSSPTWIFLLPTAPFRYIVSEASGSSVSFKLTNELAITLLYQFSAGQQNARRKNTGDPGEST